MNKNICIHAHFSQPPRRNPWLQSVELDDAAYPYHDKHEQAAIETYVPMIASQVFGSDGVIRELCNNYEYISFDFSPLLLSWLQEHLPGAYSAIIDADYTSRQRCNGHGNAIAQVYNYQIMPLASDRNRETQLAWTIDDFEERFGRKPEGLWLPETAVDNATLESLASHGIIFTILAQSQARKVREPGSDSWIDVSEGRVDCRQPYLVNLPSGRSISVFFYDEVITRQVTSGQLFASGQLFGDQLIGGFSGDGTEPEIVTVAHDGEVYGSLFRTGEVALSDCLSYLREKKTIGVTNYGDYLERFPARYEVELFGNSSRSCPHGVEKWRADCACSGGSTDQRKHARAAEWKVVLRGAVEWLDEMTGRMYEDEMSVYTDSPWEVRDQYLSVVNDRSEASVERFFRKHFGEYLSLVQKTRLLSLLEMQRNAMMMYSGYGWECGDIADSEAVQILLYAARVMQLAREINAIPLEDAFVRILERSRSSKRSYVSGAQVYRMAVQPAVVDMIRVGAHYAVSSLFEKYEAVSDVYSYTVTEKIRETVKAGLHRMALGKVDIFSQVTWKTQEISYAIIHLGGQNVIGGVQSGITDEEFKAMKNEVTAAFQFNDIAAIIAVLDRYFQSHTYSLWHLFRDDQRKIIERIIASDVASVESIFRQVHDHHYATMKTMRDMHIPIPKQLKVTLDFMLNRALHTALEDTTTDLTAVNAVLDEIDSWSASIDKDQQLKTINRRINEIMDEFAGNPDDIHILGLAQTILYIASVLEISVNLWYPQYMYRTVGSKHFREMEKRREAGDKYAIEWVQRFTRVGNYLQRSGQ